MEGSKKYTGVMASEIPRPCGCVPAKGNFCCDCRPDLYKSEWVKLYIEAKGFCQEFIDVHPRHIPTIAHKLVSTLLEWNKKESFVEAIRKLSEDEKRNGG